MQAAPITPYDLATIAVAGLVVGYAIAKAETCLRDWFRARQEAALLRKATLFRFRS